MDIRAPRVRFTFVDIVALILLIGFGLALLAMDPL